jgi:hypothetical protein
VTDLFAENVYQDAPIMRGVYFTSGTQEGRPIDRIMKSMAEAFGVSARAAAVAVSKPKSYFLRDLFTEVVFPTRTSPSGAPGSGATANQTPGADCLRACGSGRVPLLAGPVVQHESRFHPRGTPLRRQAGGRPARPGGAPLALGRDAGIRRGHGQDSGNRR